MTKSGFVVANLFRKRTRTVLTLLSVIMAFLLFGLLQSINSMFNAGEDFVGATRLITQMYFPGDPLFAFDPIFQSIPDEKVRERMVSKFDLETTQPQWALGYKFDIVLRGPEATPFEA